MLPAFGCHAGGDGGKLHVGNAQHEGGVRYIDDDQLTIRVALMLITGQGNREQTRSITRRDQD